MIDSPFSCLKFQGLSKNTSATDSGVRLCERSRRCLDCKSRRRLQLTTLSMAPVIDYRKTKSTVHTVLFE